MTGAAVFLRTFLRRDRWMLAAWAIGAVLLRFGIRSLTSQPPTLEQLFLRHYGDPDAADAAGDEASDAAGDVAGDEAGDQEQVP